MNTPSASARTEVNAPPEVVYALLSDLPGMSCVAEEFEHGSWLGGAREAADGGCHEERTWDRRPSWFRPVASCG